MVFFLESYFLEIKYLEVDLKFSKLFIFIIRYLKLKLEIEFKGGLFFEVNLSFS